MTPFDDLQLLRAMVRIVESGSISAAARSMHMAQPALSRRLQLLERRFGATLLQRDTHALAPTAAGRRALVFGRRLLRAVDAAFDRFKEEQQELGGHLRLFSSIEIGQTAVSCLLARYLREHPAMTAELRYANCPVQMIEGGYDVGIVAGELTDDRLVVRHELPLPRRLVAAPALVCRLGAPQGAADLARWPWAVLAGSQFGGPSGPVTLVAPSGEVHRMAIVPRLIIESPTGMREAVREGLAVAILPTFLVGGDLAESRLQQPLPGWQCCAGSLRILCCAGRQRLRRVDQFVALATAFLPRFVADAPAGPQPANDAA